MTVALWLFWLSDFFLRYALSICQANAVFLIVWLLDQQISSLLSLLSFDRWQSKDDTNQTSKPPNLGLAVDFEPCPLLCILQFLAAVGHRPTSQTKPICRPRVEFAHLFSRDVYMIPWSLLGIFAKINCKRTVVFLCGLASKQAWNHILWRKR